jgi:hypothetical protein
VHVRQARIEEAVEPLDEAIDLDTGGRSTSHRTVESGVECWCVTARRE